MIPEKIIKKAGVLQHRLKHGSINLIELQEFFVLVEQESASPVAKNVKNDRFTAQLENLERGRAIKPRKPK